MGTAPGGPGVDPMAVLGPHLHDGVPLARAAAAREVPERTARRWLAAYRTHGPAGLARKQRADAGGRRTPARIVEVVEGMALRRIPPTVAFIHRTVSELAAREGLPVPTYWTVWSIVTGIDPGAATLAHDGPVAYRDQYELAMRREAHAPNEIWQADHTQCDIMIRDHLGHPARPWITIILDDHSRVAAGYTVFLGEPSTMQTALALRQGIWRKTDPGWAVCGLPGTLYCDHGSDFTSAHLEQFCHDTGIELVHSQIARPQGRGKVERFMGTLTTELLQGLPGFIPHGNRGRPITDPALSLAEFDAAVGRFIVTDYNNRVHVETGQPPLQRWLAGGWLPRLPESYEQLDILLTTVAKPRIVHRDGIKLHGVRYLDLNLAAYVGEAVEVRYDPRDLAEIRIYHQGQFIARAVAPEFAQATISLKDLQAARNRRRRDLRKMITARRQLADALTAPDLPNNPTPEQPEPAPPPRPVRKLRLYQTD